ncbi:MAG: RNA-binding domain-containing protein [Candidatus Bathyarchaeia archaeon]
MDKVAAHVEVDVNPTESEDGVRKAIWNLFGSLPLEVKPAHKGSALTAEAGGQETLGFFRDALRREHIRDAARRALLASIRGNSINFCLNKQAAYVGHVSFSAAEAESPLGPIRVTVECENPRELIDWLAPRTGKPRE